MRFPSLALVTLSLASFAAAQVFTSTLTWYEGDTLIMSRTTDADGDTIYRTLSTVTGTAAANTATTTRRTTTSSSGRTTAATSTAKTTATALATGATNSDGVAVIPASGTQLSYDQFSSLVASPLESAYYATVSSAAGQRIPSWSPSSGLLVSLGVAVVGGAVGAGAFLA